MRMFKPFFNGGRKFGKKAALGLIALSYCWFERSKKLSCCGIIGYVGKEKIAVEVCVEGIQVLQFRGYDSCGICTYNEEKKDFQITKLASDSLDSSREGYEDCIVKVTKNAPKEHAPSRVGIGHTRWATHGKKISLNAHPHVDFSGKFSLVHNGVIDNFKELKAFLESKGITCISETDTEVIVQLIGYFYSQGMSFFESVKEVLEKYIVGTYALLVMNKDEPGKIIASRYGSPLLVGVGNDFLIVSSDSYAFQKYTSFYYMIESGSIVELNDSLKINDKLLKETAVEEIHKVPKKEYKHFMIQEILEQPETISRAMNFGGRIQQINKVNYISKLGGLEANQEILKKGKNLIIIATGTSYWSSLFVSNIFKKLNTFNTVQVIDACEFCAEDIPQENPLALFVTQSGESKEILTSVRKSANMFDNQLVRNIEKQRNHLHQYS